MKRPVITLLSDFGIADHYVACMKGVILGICPDAELVDISHSITPYAIAEGAYTLAQAWHCFPEGTTHLAVVDPGVGGTRRPILAEVAGHRFVAPDNGVLSLVIDTDAKARVREITANRYFRKPISNTFHGRDIFAPIVARLACGLAPAKVGAVISDPILSIAKPKPARNGSWLGTVLKIDQFGNVITNFDRAAFQEVCAGRFRLKFGGKTVSHFCATYSEAPKGQLFALWGSSGYLEVSLNQSDAAQSLGVVPGAAAELISR
jgi:S-adenosylmethionine hydrolase